ncbi:septum formation inhibitor nucleotide-binding protein Maf [Ameyamaea chiangmaiensis NBRC 103196]|nr:septum formation inhibitor nucleotide-binding protein Maf [Ameyamaea chiangmaiensis NBRC 103196]
MIKRMCREQGAGVDETACALAEAKARAVASSDGTLVIGADQILALGEQRFDKPADRAQARRHLLALRGRTHHLHTAIVVCRGTDVLWRHVARPSLRMRSFSDACLDAYLAMEGDAVLASVGAYRLEGPGVHLFEAIEGDHSAILGLPMLPLLAALRDLHAAPI